MMNVLQLFKKPEEPQPDTRTELRRIRSERIQAEKDLAESRASIDRIGRIVEAVAETERAEAAASAAVQAAAQKWAAGGAVGEPDDAAFVHQLQQAQNASVVARSRAQGSRDALPTWKQRESEASNRLERLKNEEERAALAVVLVEIGEERLQAVEKARAAWLEAVREFDTFRLFSGGGSHHEELGSYGHRVGIATNESFHEFHHRIAPNRVIAESAGKHEELVAASKRYADFQQRLVYDPEATFS